MKFTATDKTAKKKTKSKNIKTRVIPGYHLSLGIVVTMLSVIVLIPLASVLVYSLKISPGDFVALIMKENVRNAFITSITSSFRLHCRQRLRASRFQSCTRAQAFLERA